MSQTVEVRFKGTRKAYFVWGDEADRVVRVAAGWAANPGYTSRLLVALKGEFDAVSCAGYFEVNQVEFGQAVGPADVLKASLERIETRTLPNLRLHRPAGSMESWRTAASAAPTRITRLLGQCERGPSRTLRSVPPRVGDRPRGAAPRAAKGCSLNA